jgi:hypothetical protein
MVINEFSNLNCGTRADIAIQHDQEIEAIEIKSARDSIKRLENQLKLYQKYFDRVTIIVDSSHFKHVYDMCQDQNAGIILYSQNTFVEKKRSRRKFIHNDVIRNFLLPSSLKGKDFKQSDTRQIFLRNIQQRYSQNRSAVETMLQRGFAIESDLEALNPYSSRRKSLIEHSNKNTQTWAKLIETFKGPTSHLLSVDLTESDSCVKPA